MDCSKEKNCSKEDTTAQGGYCPRRGTWERKGVSRKKIGLEQRKQTFHVEIKASSEKFRLAVQLKGISRVM